MTEDFAATIVKPPTAERFHRIDIGAWLTTGETVTASEVISSDPALQIDRVTTPTGFIRWRARGGVNGQDYVVTVTVTTNLERKEPVFIRYSVRKPQGA